MNKNRRYSLIELMLLAVFFLNLFFVAYWLATGRELPVIPAK